MLLISLATILISLISPVFGLFFMVAFSLSYCHQKGKNSTITISLVIAGFVALFAFKAIALMDLADLLIGVAMVAWIFLLVYEQKENITKALYSAAFVQFGYGFIRTLIFGDIHSERIQILFGGYYELMELRGVSQTNGNMELSSVIESIRTWMVDYQLAVWVITMTFALYLGTVYFARRIDNSNWNHSHIRMPYGLVYLLIVSLLLSIFPSTRTAGLNFLFVIGFFFLIQGLAIVDFWFKKHLTKSRFAIIATIFLMFINIFFALMVAIIGLIDYWLDLRKLNHL